MKGSAWNDPDDYLPVLRAAIWLLIHRVEDRLHVCVVLGFSETRRKGTEMTTTRTVVEFVHDTGYGTGDNLLTHINNAIRGKDMVAVSVNPMTGVQLAFKPLEWEGSGWKYVGQNKLFQFTVLHNPHDPESGWHVQGDARIFPSLEKAKQWCQQYYESALLEYIQVATGDAK